MNVKPDSLQTKILLGSLVDRVSINHEIQVFGNGLELSECRVESPNGRESIMLLKDVE